MLFMDHWKFFFKPLVMQPMTWITKMAKILNFKYVFQVIALITNWNSWNLNPSGAEKWKHLHNLDLILMLYAQIVVRFKRWLYENYHSWNKYKFSLIPYLCLESPETLDLFYQTALN